MDGDKHVPWTQSRVLKGVAAIGTATGAVLGVKEVLDLDGPGWSKTLAIGLLVVNGLLVLLLLWVERQHRQELYSESRSARFATATPQIHQAFHRLRDASHEAAKRGEVDDILVDLQASLHAMAIAYTAISGVPCRLCIKDLIFIGDSQGTAKAHDFEVRTLCRHDRVIDSTDKVTKHDLVADNTDFRILFDESSDDRWFFCNDVAKRPGYVNSHAPDGDFSRLSYRSTIVWPIQRQNPTASGLRQHEVWGFLCLDAKEPNVFVEAWDVQLGAAFADTLYTLLAEIVKRGQQAANSEPP